MPIGRLENVSPAVKSRNTDSPLGRLRESPHSNTTFVGSIVAGSPIGLLLALTYAEDHSGTEVVTTRAEKMFIKIRNTD